MAEQRVQRRLAAIMTADVAGYSRLMGADEAGTRARFNELFGNVVRPAIERYQGRLVKTMGDGFLVEFGSVVDSLQCAVDVQGAVAAQTSSTPADRKITLRIGVHLGDVMVEGDDIHGDGVNIAARLEGLAEPGGVCLSGDVYRQARGKLDAVFVDLGEQSIKNIAEPIQVFGIDLTGAQSPDDRRIAIETVLERNAVAVLPFMHFGGDPEQEYFADGLTEDIISALSMWRSFPVIARNSTFAYKGQSPDVRKVGEELGARYVLEGSVRRSGKRVRVTAQLIDANTGHHIWAERYDRDLEDIFAIQDELTQGIAAVVVPELERAQHKRLILSTPQDLGAWDLFLQGMAKLAQFSKASNLEARQIFERAIAIDPEYSRAYAGLAFTYHREVQFGIGESTDDALVRQLEYARRAVQLDGADYFGHWELAIGYALSRQYDLSLMEARRALELNPSDAHCHTAVGQACVLLGRVEEAIENLEIAMRLNPHDPRLHFAVVHLARAHFTAGRYEEAHEWLRRAIERSADNPDTYLLKAATLGHLGEISQARESLAACRRLNPTYLDSQDLWFTYKDDSANEHLRDGLRKAGWEG